MGPNQTTGIVNNGVSGTWAVGDDQKAETTPTVPPLTPQSSTMVRDVIPVMKSLEERLPFTAILLSILGYISIATFGQMNSTAKYIGYIIFLTISFLVYKFLTREIVEKKSKDDFYKVGFYLLISINLLVFGMVFVLTHYLEIKQIVKNIDASFAVDQEMKAELPTLSKL